MLGLKLNHVSKRGHWDIAQFAGSPGYVVLHALWLSTERYSQDARSIDSSLRFVPNYSSTNVHFGITKGIK